MYGLSLYAGWKSVGWCGGGGMDPTPDPGPLPALGGRTPAAAARRDAARNWSSDSEPDPLPDKLRTTRNNSVSQVDHQESSRRNGKTPVRRGSDVHKYRDNDTIHEKPFQVIINK